MSSAAADDQYEAQNDTTGGDVPAGDSMDNDYASRTGQSHIPVLKDEKDIEDPIDPATADSDETLSMYFENLLNPPVHTLALSSWQWLRLTHHREG